MKKLIAMMLAVLMLVGMLAGCGGTGASAETPASAAGSTAEAPAEENTDAEASAEAPAEVPADVVLDGSWPEETVKIGVATFDTTDENFLGVQAYYESLKEFYNVEFIYSESMSSAEDEFAFIDSCAAAGCKGYIAYYNVAGAESIKECTSQGMYYWGTGEFYDEVADDPYYCGSYTFLDPENPDAHNGDYLAGYDLGYSMAKQGVKHIAYCNGGASFGIEMFIDRQQGFFDGIADAQAEGAEVAFDAEKDVIAGWPGTDEFTAAQSATIAGDYDAVASAFNVAMWFQPVMESGKDIKLGCVGSVSETYQAFVDMGVVTALVYDCEETVFGVAFADIMNCVTGHPELSQNADGKALQNYTQRWTVSDAETFNAIYDYHASGKYFVSAEQVATVLGALNPEATYQDVVDLYNMSVEEAVASIK